MEAAAKWNHLLRMDFKKSTLSLRFSFREISVWRRLARRGGRQTEMSRSDRGVWEDNRRPADRVACVIKRLATEFQSLQQLGVFRQVVTLYVVEELTTASRHLQKAAARVEVLAMRAQVIGQVIDPGCEQRDLNFGRTGILIVCFII